MFVRNVSIYNSYSNRNNTVIKPCINNVNFGAMKKSEFEGIDYAVVEKFKAPIEKFNTSHDLQDWADNQSDEILNKKYKGRHLTISHQRNKILSDWNNYFLENYSTLPPSVKLIALKSITKDLKTNNDKLPPDFSQTALMAALDLLNSELKTNPKYQFDFNKMYMSELKSSYIDNDETGETQTGWITIPSGSHDKANFALNTAKLKTLSAKRWCTKSTHAESYLRNGDFHIYLEAGNPKVAIRFFDNDIVEIEGELNNGTIPQAYLDVVQTYIDENNFSTTSSVKNELIKAGEKGKIIENAKYDLRQAIETNDVETIFDYFNISYETDKDGLIILNGGYCQPDRGITWKELGIDENNLLKRIKEINGYCDMSRSDATDLGEVRKINGHLKLAHSKLNDLGKLEFVENIDFSNSKIKTLGNLVCINKNGIFSNSDVTNLGRLRYIGGDADFSNSKLKSLANLEIIMGNACFKDSEIIDLGNLRKIGKNADFSGAKIQNLANLTSIGKNAVFANSEIKNPGNLETIGGYADFFNSKIENLGNLKTIYGDAIFNNTPLTSLGNLECIGGTIRFSNTNINDIGRLEKIGKDAIFADSKISTLNNLEKIGGNAVFSDSMVIDIGALRYIGGNADFSNSQIRNYKGLAYIGGNATFDKGFVPHRNNIHILGRIIERRTYSEHSNRNSNSGGYLDKFTQWLIH